MTRDEPRLELAVVSGSKGKILIIMATVQKHPVPQETVYHFGRDREYLGVLDGPRISEANECRGVCIISLGVPLNVEEEVHSDTTSKS
jgi:hypothetical protein